MDTSAIRALVFDAYGTLFDVNSIASLCEEVAPGREGELSRLWRAKQLEYSWLRSLMGSYVDFWQVTRDALVFASRSLGLAPSQTQLDRLMNAYLCLSPFPEVPEALHSLTRFPKAILSNGTKAMLDAVVRNAKLQWAFAHILSVDEVKTYKTSPRVYALATQRLVVEPRQVLFVSSNNWDVQGAKAFGFRVCWLNRTKVTPDELGHNVDLEFSSLEDLVDALKGR